MGPCHILQLARKFNRKPVKSSLGGAGYARSEMADQMSLLRDFYAPLEALGQGMLGLQDCESLCTHPTTKKKITEKHLVRHFLRTQQALGQGELDNVYWLPSTENPAEGLTRVRSDTAPLPKKLESGRLNPGSFRPLEGEDVCNSVIRTLA